MFYLFFPLTCRVLSRGNLLIALLAGFVVMGPLARAWLAHGNDVWREYSYLGGMDAIALGCLTALIIQKIQVSPRILIALGTPLMLFTLCYYRALGPSMTILAIGTCLIIAASAQTGWRSP